MKTSFTFLSFAAAFLLQMAGFLFAQSFTLQQVLSAPFPDGLVAADTGRIAWFVDARGVRNIWVADGPDYTLAGGPGAARQLTHYTEDDGLPIASLRITPDGTTLVYVRGSEASGEGVIANPRNLAHALKQQVFAVTAAGGEPRLLGEMGCPEEGCEDVQLSPDGKWAVWAAKKQLWIASLRGVAVKGTAPALKQSAGLAKALTEVRGANSQPKWSPDGRYLAFVSDRGDHSWVAVLELHRPRAKSSSGPGSGPVRYLAATTGRDGSPRWSPDGRYIAFIRLAGSTRDDAMIPVMPQPWAIWRADVTTGEGRELWHSGDADRDSLPGWTADGSFYWSADDRIVFASEQDGQNHVYSIAAGGGPQTLLTPGAFDVEQVTLSHDRKTVIYTSNQDDIERRHIWRVAAAGGVPQAVTKGLSAEWSPTEVVSNHTSQIICLGSTGTTPAMPYAITPSGDRKLIAASSLPRNFPDGLVTPQIVTFPSEDGLTIHGQLFLPPPGKGNGAGLIFTHGGPIRQMMPAFHYMDYYHNAYAMNQYLASRGYTVLSVNYRLGIMYGRAFREARNGGWRGSSEYQDVVAGARYLQQVPGVDARKLGLWGGSYGGLLTALGLARNSNIFAAGVDFHGVHDWSAYVGAALRPDRPAAPDAKNARELARQSSPVADADHWQSPVLFVHGDDDRNVEFSQTVDLAERLRRRHVAFEELIFPDEIHGFLLYQNWIKAYLATEDFFDRKLLSKRP